MLNDCRPSRGPGSGAAANDSRLPLGNARWTKGIAASAAAGALLLQVSLSGCAASGGELKRDAALSFVCEGGRSFRVDFLDRQVRVTTSANSYYLDRRPSSIGTKYASGDTVFLRDEDRAVLVGADGGPFKSCHET
jgi:hypothetical protein